MRIRSFLLPLVLLAVTCSAHANAVYTFTGSPYTYATGFYSTSDHISGTFTLAAALAANSSFSNVTVLDFHFSDGRQSFDPTINDELLAYSLNTDANGDIDEYSIDIESKVGSNSRIHLDWTGQGSASQTAQLQSSSAGNNATGKFLFTPDTTRPIPAATPEPSSIALLGTGVLMGVGTLRRRIRATSRAV